MKKNERGCAHEDHTHCVKTAMQHAKDVCAQQKLKLTPMRQRVLEILLEAHVALGAYDILARLSEDGENVKPPIAYRALSFLVEHEFAHRIEGLNAYVACAKPGAPHTPSFIVCKSCKTVSESGIEAPSLPDVAGFSQELSAGFNIEKTTIEVEGICQSCQEQPA